MSNHHTLIFYIHEGIISDGVFKFQNDQKIEPFQQLFDGALELLPDPLNEDLTLMEEILTKFRKDMMMQLMALKESA